jgi:hypothetical protein
MPAALQIFREFSLLAEAVSETYAVLAKRGAGKTALSTYRRAYTASARCGILIPQQERLVRGTRFPETEQPSRGCNAHFCTNPPIHTPSLPG